MLTLILSAALHAGPTDLDEPRLLPSSEVALELDSIERRRPSWVLPSVTLGTGVFLGVSGFLAGGSGFAALFLAGAAVSLVVGATLLVAALVSTMQLDRRVEALRADVQRKPTLAELTPDERVWLRSQQETRRRSIAPALITAAVSVALLVPATLVGFAVYFSFLPLTIVLGVAAGSALGALTASLFSMVEIAGENRLVEERSLRITRTDQRAEVSTPSLTLARF